ncbi:MAG TPA: hypothetical protein VGI39_38360 [Polyangiaceae bacterium]|jgi:hypothetical protein
MEKTVACVECGRKGSGSKEKLLAAGWKEKSPGRWVCPGCIVTIVGGGGGPGL